MVKITLYKGQVKNSMNKTNWPTFLVDNRLLFFKKNNNKIMLNTVTLKANCGSTCTSKNQAYLYSERTNLLLFSYTYCTYCFHQYHTKQYNVDTRFKIWHDTERIDNLAWSENVRKRNLLYLSKKSNIRCMKYLGHVEYRVTIRRILSLVSKLIVICQYS